MRPLSSDCAINRTGSFYCGQRCVLLGVTRRWLSSIRRVNRAELKVQHVSVVEKSREHVAVSRSRAATMLLVCTRGVHVQNSSPIRPKKRSNRAIPDITMLWRFFFFFYENAKRYISLYFFIASYFCFHSLFSTRLSLSLSLSFDFFFSCLSSFFPLSFSPTESQFTMHGLDPRIRILDKESTA